MLAAVGRPDPTCAVETVEVSWAGLGRGRLGMPPSFSPHGLGGGVRRLLLMPVGDPSRNGRKEGRKEGGGSLARPWPEKVGRTLVRLAEEEEGRMTL